MLLFWMPCLLLCLSSACHVCSYHDGEPKGLQFLNDLDAQLQFAHPLKQAGVDGVIIWGDEEQPSGRAALLQWFNNQSNVFGSSDTTNPGSEASKPGSASDQNYPNTVEETLRTPPIPRDGPIPPYVECGL